jgi:hypothetical protein
MSESIDTSAIDEKNQPSNYFSNVGSFGFNVFIFFIIIVLYFGSGSLVLYACKLGQSNILPTNVHCFPYKDTKPVINNNKEPIKINIFNTILSDPPMSNKISFPYNEFNSSNKILDLFREYKSEPRSNFLANYFISILDSITQFNYSSLNFILNLLNGIPEFLIVILGPIIAAIVLTALFLVDHLYLIYLWFAGMGWFFKTNTNDTGLGKPKWEDVTFINLFSYCCAIWLVILFVIIFFFSFPFLSVIAFLSMSWCAFSCITYKAELNGTSITSATIIQNVFKYYKLLIMGIFCLLVIISAFAKLGTIPGLFCVLVLVLIYWGIISINIIKPISKENLTPLVDYKQAIKTCSGDIKLKPSEKHGLLYNILFGGKKEENIAKDLKQLGKKLYDK